MPSIPRNFIETSIHHIYNRGTQKMELFKNDRDYERFLSRMQLYKQKYEVHILAWSLMPNHFHLIVRVPNQTRAPDLKGHQEYNKEDYKFNAGEKIPLDKSDRPLRSKSSCPSDISKFMQQLQNAYAKYFALKYDFSGKPFQGTFKSKLIEKQEYWLQAINYVHAQASHHLKIKDENWKYSSLRQYLRKDDAKFLADIDEDLILLDEYPALFADYSFPEPEL